MISKSAMRDKWSLDSISEINCYREITPHPKNRTSDHWITNLVVGLKKRLITCFVNNSIQIAPPPRTYPPFSTGIITRINGGSNGKFSCKVNVKKRLQTWIRKACYIPYVLVYKTGFFPFIINFLAYTPSYKRVKITHQKNINIL